MSAKNEDRLQQYAKNLTAFLQVNSELSVRDIAFTLQTGRVPMDERLALVTSGLSDLIEKLNSFCDDTKNVSGVFRGNAKNNKSRFNLLLDGAEGKEFFANIIKNKKYNNLAQLWVDGADVEWETMHNRRFSGRVPIPGYPFEKKSYWVNSYKEAQREINNEISILMVKKNNTQNHSREDTQGKDILINEELLLYKTVKKLLSEVLHVNPEEISDEETFENLGFDSLLSIEFIENLEKKFEIKIDSSIFYDYPTINKAIKYLSKYILELKNKENRENKSNNLYLTQKTNTHITNENNISSFNNVLDTQSIIPKTDNAIKRNNFTCKNIFLTGSTGILGAYVLKELLLTTDSTIFCLVREKNHEDGLKKIKKILLKYIESDKLQKSISERIIPVLGDIEDEKLNINNDEYNKLSNEIDIILHIAALTNLFLPYNRIAPINVGGVKNIINFVLQTKQKYLFYVSSFSIIGDLIYKSNISFTEKDFYLGQKFHKMGYQQSKFEGEKLIRDATSKGLNWDIVRPGYIYGDSMTGIYPFGLTGVTGILYEIFELIIKTGISIFGLNYFDITPVDYIAKAILYLGLKKEDYYETFHLVNPDKKRWHEIINLLIDYGYKIKYVNVDNYLNLMKNNTLKYRDSENEQMALKLMKSHFKTDAFNNDCCVDATYTKNILEKANIICPKIDNKLINTYLEYCITNKILPPPEK